MLNSYTTIADLAEPTSFDLNDTKFCDSAHFTWDVTGNTACLKEQIIQVNDKAFTLGPSSRSYTITKAAYNNTQICLAVASRNYERTSMFSPEHCIAFDGMFKSNHFYCELILITITCLNLI